MGGTLYHGREVRRYLYNVFAELLVRKGLNNTRSKSGLLRISWPGIEERSNSKSGGWIWIWKSPFNEVDGCFIAVGGVKEVPFCRFGEVSELPLSWSVAFLLK